MKIKLADYVISWLSSKGVKTIFTVSGGGSIVLCDALFDQSKIRYICCHHEQSVAFAAEGVSRSGKDLGVGLVTSGPGGTNTLTGLAGAWIDSVPMLIISGQSFLSQTIGNSGVRQLGVQESDMVEMSKSVTKFSKMVENPNDIRDILEESFFLATTGRPGPVLIDIPVDIQNSFIEIEKLNDNFKANFPEYEISSYQEKILIQKLDKSQRPILHIGHGAKKDDAFKDIIDFAVLHNIPIMTTWNATDLVPSDNTMFVGRPGAFAERAANFNIQNCDLYISIGSRLPYMVTGYNKKDFARNAYKIIVDIDQAEISKNDDIIDLGIKCDAKSFIKTLSKVISLDLKFSDDWVGQCRDLRKKYPISQSTFINQDRWVYSYYFIEKLSNHLDSKSNVFTDMGLSFVGTHQAFKVKKGQKVVTNSGHAPMGWGLPAAIGSYFSDKSRNTICLTGEGGLMMNIQELATVKHHNIPMKIFIYNNGGYQTIKETQIFSFQGRLMGCNESSGVSFPNFEKVADSYSIKYTRISNNKEVDLYLSEILKIEEPHIIEIMIDPDQQHIPRAVNRKTKDGKSMLGKYEDLYPFLSNDEIQENLI